jgi:hypothetical protein
VFNKTRLFDHCLTLGATLTGFAVGNVLPISDPKTDSIAFVAGGALILLGWVGVTRLDSAPGVEVEPAPVVERRIPNLNDAPKAPNGFMSLRELNYNETAVKSVKLQQRDPRLIQWAYAVAYNNAPMKQTKWCGGKRLFSKPEYERWIACLLEKKIITFANPKNPAGGYKPNGAMGWRMIKDIADTRVYIPLPSAVLSEEQIRFVSARMREANSLGQGSG